MSKIACITDTHTGARGGSKVFRELFREYYQDEFFPYLHRQGIKTIYHLGDFFDNRSSLSLHDIDYVVNEFLPLLEHYGIDLIVLAGNHDVAYRNTNAINSLSILKTSPRVTVVQDELLITEPGGDKKFIFCPWLNSENFDVIMEELKHYATDDYILLGHFEVEGAKMYKNSKVCESGIKPSQLKKFHKVLSGHFHHPSVYGNIEYIGALFHYNWQDYDDWRGFKIYDTEDNSFESVENPFCLFTWLTYSKELIETNDEDLKALCSGQFVRISIDEEYDRIDLKELVNRIERQSPIDVDVIDNTIIETVSEASDDDSEQRAKAITDYAYEALEGHDREKQLTALFDEVYEAAKQKMKEIE